MTGAPARAGGVTAPIRKEPSMHGNAHSSVPFENWHVAKPAGHGRKGVVVAQEIEAARTGAGVISTGGDPSRPLAIAAEPLPRARRNGDLPSHRKPGPIV